MVIEDGRNDGRQDGTEGVCGECAGKATEGKTKKKMG